MNGWVFTSSIFKLEEVNQYNPDKDRKGSDGWGFEFADWLKPELERVGYKVPEFEPDTCGWSLKLPFDSYRLEITCMVIPASSLSNRDELGLDSSDDCWQMWASSSGPSAQGGLLKKMFGKPDPALVAQRDMKLAALNSQLANIMASEPAIRLIDGEPEIDSNDD